MAILGMAGDSVVYDARWMWVIQTQDMEMAARYLHRLYPDVHVLRRRPGGLEDVRVLHCTLGTHYERDDIMMAQVDTERDYVTFAVCTKACAQHRGLLRLHHAIELGDMALFEERLRLGDDIHTVDVMHVLDGPRDANGLLSRCVQYREVEMLRRLLDLGVDIHAVPMNLYWLFMSSRLLIHLCAHGLRPFACGCRVNRPPADAVPLLRQAGFQPCARPTCPLRQQRAKVLTLERQCSNAIRRNRVDMTALPRALADRVGSFEV